LAIVGKPLFKVADLKHVYLRSYFTSGQLADIKLGQTVTVFADFGGDNRREYRGAITWISDKSEFTPKSIQTKKDRENLVYAVKIAVENDGYIKIGMYGEVQLRIEN
jgi:HlyD family secretion protein